ncbi:Uncharacterized protein Adt_18638 [Abeliophyllum distichum]|uniref:Uncharacterized protein n=1 Tax=Abeliophyllum distichum TaxID=126358 RepID=A0ABD1TK99_9LAMI
MLNYMLIADVEDEEAVEDTMNDEEDMGIMQISLNALMENNVPKIIRIPREIRGNKISILINSMSTHSFIDDILIYALGFQNDNNKPLTVTVANGQKLESRSVNQPLI